MWMGKTSAWTAVVFGVLLLALAALQARLGALTIVPLAVLIAVALALLVGAYRTLRGLSGGLRLLAGAWGITAGVLLPQQGDPDPGRHSYSVPDVYAAIYLSLPVIALVCLMLTVLHKER